MTQTLTTMNYITRPVGIAEMVVSNSADDILVTYSLGSCIGVTVYDPQTCVGGLIHCMLPSSKLEPDKAKARPHMFTDTGMISLLQAVLDMGGDMKRLKIKVAGAASPMDACGRFKIGERNHTTLRKVLWKNNLMLEAEDVGGTKPRTMTLRIADGRVTIKSSRTEVEL